MKSAISFLVFFLMNSAFCGDSFRTQPPLFSSTDIDFISSTPTTKCFCQYYAESDDLLAFSDGTELGNGSSIEIGQSIQFRCKRVGYHRFDGPRVLNCRECKRWGASELPKCTAPKIDELAIYISKNLSILPNGSLEIVKGQSVRLGCASTSSDYPTWSFTGGPRGGPHVYTKRKQIKCKRFSYYYSTRLYIKDAEPGDTGFYSCSRKGSQPIVIHILVKPEKNSSCYVNSLLEKIPSGVRPDSEIINLSRIPVNSSLKLVCDDDDTVLSGKASADCDADGKWQVGGMLCETGCKPIKKLSTSQLMIDPDKKIYKNGETVKFSCPSPLQLINGPIQSICFEGDWGPTEIPECK